MSDAPDRDSAPNDTEGSHPADDTDPTDGPVDDRHRTEDTGAGRAPSDGADDEWDDPPRYESSGSGIRARDVEVPMRVYKAVTVFSTAFAVICVVAGFVLLDRATGRAQLPLAEVDPILAVLGIATILFGAATYAFSTRFRAAGMGRSKNDDDEPSDNG